MRLQQHTNNKGGSRRNMGCVARADCLRDQPDWIRDQPLLDRQKYMLENQRCCDVTMIVGGSKTNQEVIRAHRVMLICGSPVFEAMYERWHAAQKTFILVDDVDPKAFYEMLKFFYNEEADINAENAVLILHVSKKYLVNQLSLKCVRFLESHVNLENVCRILDASIRFDEPGLADRCMQFIYVNASRILTSEEFHSLEYDSVMKFVSSDDLIGVSELELHAACLRWSKVTCSTLGYESTDENIRLVLRDIVYQIRFAAMSRDEFFKATNDFGVLLPEEKSVLLDYITSSEPSRKQRSCMKFNPRNRKQSCEVVINRFLDVQCGDRGWICHLQQTDAIDFICNTNIMMHGISLYGGKKISDHSVQAYLLDNRGNVMTTTIDPVLESDGNVSPIRVYFKTNVKLQSNVRYSVVVKLHGSGTYYGVNGRCEESRGKIRVNFLNSRHSSRGWTTVSKGQIPELIFAELID